MDTYRKVAEFAGIDTKIYNDRGEPVEPKNPDILRIKLLEPEGSMAIMEAWHKAGVFRVMVERVYQLMLAHNPPTLPEAILNAAVEFVKE